MSFIIENSGNGTQAFTEDQLQIISDGDLSTSTTVSGGHTSSFDLSLNNLFYVDGATLYIEDYNSVSFYGSRSDAGGLEEITTSVITSGISAEINRYYNMLRMNISATVDATIYGISVSIDSNNILFGEQAQDEEYDIDKNFSEPQLVKIFNYTGTEKDAYVFLSESGTGTGLSLGLISSGTDYYSYHGNGVAFPDDFSWAAGRFYNTMISGTSIAISGSNLYGYYITPVIEIQNRNVSRVFYEANTTNSMYVDFPTDVEGPRTIGTRLYNKAPTFGWVNGSFPNDSDENWSVLTGSIPFEPYENDQVLNSRHNDSTLYVQFYLGLYTTVTGESPLLSRVGVEYPTVVSGVQPQYTGNIYIKTASPETLYTGLSGLDVYFLG